jgi:hypothetical protein
MRICHQIYNLQGRPEILELLDKVEREDLISLIQDSVEKYRSGDSSAACSKGWLHPTTNEPFDLVVTIAAMCHDFP